MKKSSYFVLAITLVFLFSSVGLAEQNNVKQMKKEGVGNYLTDAAGMSLYWFKKDTKGVSNCSGDCLEKWPAFYQEKVMAADGIKDADFGTITRADGKMQTTFRGYPLYYFFKDKMTGDTAGQGAKEVWYLVDPAHFPPM